MYARLIWEVLRQAKHDCVCEGGNSASLAPRARVKVTQRSFAKCGGVLDPSRPVVNDPDNSQEKESHRWN